MTFDFIIVGAGSAGSTEILFQSERAGLSLSRTLAVRAPVPTSQPAGMSRLFQGPGLTWGSSARVAPASAGAASSVATQSAAPELPETLLGTAEVGQIECGSMRTSAGEGEVEEVVEDEPLVEGLTD